MQIILDNVREINIYPIQGGSTYKSRHILIKTAQEENLEVVCLGEMLEDLKVKIEKKRKQQ